MGEQIRHELPEVMMKAIEAISRDQSMTAQERFSAMVITAFGTIMFQDSADLKAWDYAIPQAQWARLCSACTDLDKDRLAAVNYGLSWMNSGPSAYEEANTDAGPAT